MSDYEKELEAFLIKIGQVQPVAPKPAQSPKKDEE
ncbi:hypothetical protein UFOVP1495_3 [uncultured Caudovirales phage]|jgi:hypothetical protein|uniref:Uncharacterized protein n=1 Tax=uncultured Caudovirales phage TaxID=2100421 RepID=A0A6J5QZB8_9CAUD|nr:hypothetical protein UFOVP1135_5 [uncultured Caudovirales phage]CAB4194321.1 hypothetical protein UFOVP1253_26 [uncultured Caudovirales phage]CAB4216968.1 hypothetical protein UFOVP1495_3 [uncultured Caudovirales phage]